MLSENLLEKLNDAGAGSGPSSLTAGNDAWSIVLDCDRVDRLSSSVTDLTLTRKVSTTPGTTVQAWAERIATSVSGLRENLKLLEVDGTQNAAILRSVTPSKKGTVASYYEVKLNGVNEANVRRYEADTDAGTRRQAVPYVLTHEVLGKLVDDIAA